MKTLEFKLIYPADFKKPLNDIKACKVLNAEEIDDDTFHFGPEIGPIIQSDINMLADIISIISFLHKIHKYVKEQSKHITIRTDNHQFVIKENTTEEEIRKTAETLVKEC